MTNEVLQFTLPTQFCSVITSVYQQPVLHAHALLELLVNRQRRIANRSSHAMLCLLTLAIAALLTSHSEAQSVEAQSVEAQSVDPSSPVVIENPFDLLPKEPTEPLAPAAETVNPDGPSANLSAKSGPTEDDQSEQSNKAEIEAMTEPPVAPAETTEDAEEPSAELPPAVGEIANPANAQAGQAPVDGSDRVLEAKYERAMIIDFDGPIFGMNASYLKNRLERAERANVDLIILRLTSPGGELETSLELSRQLRDIDWATVIAFIPRESISGGAILALGCDRIYMTPRALIGDAGPIHMGLGGQFEHAEEKIVSYLSSAINEIAESQNRPGALAQAMVDRSLKVYSATDKMTGEVRYLTKQQTLDAKLLERYEVGPEVVETGENRFLTVSGSRAVELKLAEGVFDSEDSLLQSLTIAQQTETRIHWVDRTVFFLNRPWVTGLLLIAGLIGLYIELAAPGISVAGMTSIACFGLFFWSHALGGTSGWLEVMLFVLGVACLLIELFMLPGFGVFGIAGIGLVLLSLIMATQDFILPSTKVQWDQLQTNTLIVLGSLSLVGILFMAQLLLLDSIPGLNRFQLTLPGSGESTQPAPASLVTSTSQLDALPAVGEVGKTESVLRPSGKALFDQRLIDVVSEGDFIDPGIEVEVLKREGNRVVVRKLS